MAQFQRKGKDGTRWIDNLVEGARQGNKAAQEKLDSLPEIPEGFEYLVQWAQDLYGRSGIGMSGAAPLSPTVLKDWAEGMDYAPLHPLEFEALFKLTDAMFVTDDEPAKGDTVILPQQTSQRIQRRWPKKKNEA
jgi:hypothetical protein